MEVNCSFEKLEEFIKNGKDINYGDINSFIYYDNLLVKFNPEICNMLRKRNDISEKRVMKILDSQNQSKNSFIDFRKLDYFREKSSSIKLSTLPQDVVYLNGIAVGIIEKYFPKYKWLHYLEDLSHKETYYLARNILLALRELEENGIYRLNINHNNVVYNRVKPELVDLSTCVISQNKKGMANGVYSAYLNLLYNLFKIQCFDPVLYREFAYILTINDCNYEVCEDVVKRLEKKI